MAEIGEDEGILGNDFAMAQHLTVRPHESAVYLPASSSADKEDMGERLSCAVRSVAEVRAITEEAHSGPGPNDDDAGTPDGQSGEHCHPHPKAGRDGDGGSRAWPTGFVPHTRADRGGTGQSNLGGQPRVTPSGDRGEQSDSDGGVHDRNTRDMPGGRMEQHG